MRVRLPDGHSRHRLDVRGDTGTMNRGLGRVGSCPGSSRQCAFSADAVASDVQRRQRRLHFEGDRERPRAIALMKLRPRSKLVSVAFISRTATSDCAPPAPMSLQERPSVVSGAVLSWAAVERLRTLSADVIAPEDQSLLSGLPAPLHESPLRRPATASRASRFAALSSSGVRTARLLSSQLAALALGIGRRASA